MVLQLFVILLDFADLNVLVVSFVFWPCFETVMQVVGIMQVLLFVGSQVLWLFVVGLLV